MRCDAIAIAIQVSDLCDSGNGFCALHNVFWTFGEEKKADAVKKVKNMCAPIFNQKANEFWSKLATLK